MTPQLLIVVKAFTTRARGRRTGSRTQSREDDTYFETNENNNGGGAEKREGRWSCDDDDDELLLLMMMITNPLITSRRRIAFQARFVTHRHRYQRNGRSDANVAPTRAHSGTSNNNNNYDDDDESSVTKRLNQIETVFLIVFNLGEPNEALYTTSSRHADIPRNDFLSFVSMQDAIKASVLISDQTNLMPVVESVSVDVVLFLCSRSGFGVELVEEGEIWTPPGVVIEDEEALSEDNGSIDGKKEDDNNELAISSADLEKYLADGGSFREEIREQFYAMEEEEEGEEEEQTVKTELDDARRTAAYAVQSAATRPLKALSTAFERTAKLSTLKYILQRNANRVSKTTNSALMDALQNLAIARVIKKKQDGKEN